MVEPAEAPLLEDAVVVKARVAEGLAGVERVVVVMSGKGGVGKSAVAVNLAASLAEAGQRVGLLDADLHGPSVAKMLGLRGQPVRVDRGQRLRPVPGPLGLAVQSMDFFLQGNQPLDWDGAEGEGATLRSAVEQSALADLLGQTAWGELDRLVVDLAPGSDRLPALARWLPPIAAALAVTLPTEVSLLAVERSLRRAQAARVPLIGLVENCASSVCAACGAEGPLYREASAAPLAEALGLPLLARIPFDPELARAADDGVPLVSRCPASPALRAIAELTRSVEAFEGFGVEADSW